MSPNKPVTLRRWEVGVAMATIAAGPLLAGVIAVRIADQNADECWRARQSADAQRTSALAGPTDRERTAETALLTPGGDYRAERDALLAARAEVDEARRRYPAPAPTGC